MSRLHLLVLDVDGVLTDGSISAVPQGESDKRFCVQDGCAVRLWQRCGGKVAIISGRADHGVERRAAELGVDRVHTAVGDKLPVYDAIVSSAGCGDAGTAYVGDDLPDLAPMSRCAFPVAVANAVPAVKRAALYVTRRCGGGGAVAEVIELLLRKRGLWSLSMLEKA